MIDGDVPNVSGRRRSPPRGFFKSQIRAPCALIKDLPERDQEIAMAFIKLLAIQRQELTLERRKLRKKIHRPQCRVTTISRDLQTLNSHPGDWIELGISEFACIPNCSAHREENLLVAELVSQLPIYPLGSSHTVVHVQHKKACHLNIKLLHIDHVPMTLDRPASKSFIL